MLLLCLKNKLQAADRISKGRRRMNTWIGSILDSLASGATAQDKHDCEMDTSVLSTRLEVQAFRMAHSAILTHAKHTGCTRPNNTAGIRANCGS